MSEDKPTFTKEEKEELAIRGPDGKFLKGSMLGRSGKGVSKPYNSEKRQAKKMKAIQREATLMAQEMINERLGGAAEALGEALKDASPTVAITAAKTLLQYGIGNKKAETNIEPGVMEPYLYLPPEERQRHITRLAMEGQISMEQAASLSKLCEQEIEVRVIGAIRRVAKDLEKGLDPATAMRRVAEIAQQYEDDKLPVEIEHDG